MEMIQAVYQTPGRVSVDFIVIHWINGSLDSCIQTFTAGERQASAHYGVENERVVSFVDDNDTAWSLGNWEANQRSISIEHSAQPGRDATDATYKTSIRLVADLMVKHKLTPSSDTIRPHHDFSATQCPGTLDLDRIISGVKDVLYGIDEDDIMANGPIEITAVQAESIVEETVNRLWAKIQGELVINKYQAEGIALRSASVVLENIPDMSADVVDAIKSKIEKLTFEVVAK